MWSMLTQDFTDFAEALKSESAGFMDYLGHMATDVVGRGDVYAGDEALGQAVADMPLPNALLRRLQEADATYTLPIQPEERAAFAAWMQANPLSSANTHRRQQQKPASPAEAPAGTTPQRGAGAGAYPDEPIDETRQRLLDYNESVLQRYVALVGDAVSPRLSLPGSPATPESRRWQTPSASSPASPPPPPAEKERPSPASGTTPPPPPHAAAHGCVSEDDFFDRYFFRLTQLRVSEAQRRRGAPQERPPAGTSGAAAAAAGTAAAPSTSASPASAQTSPAAKPRGATPPSAAAGTPAPTSRPGGVEDYDDDFVAVPLFAKRVMTAASGFVTGIDNALNHVVAGDADLSRSLNDDDDDEDTAANVDPADLARYSRGTRQQVANLEALVQELQEALRQERRRVAQLTEALEAHGIAVPAEQAASAAGTPAKTKTAASTPARYTDPGAASTPAAGTSPAAASAAPSPASPPATAAAIAPDSHATQRPAPVPASSGEQSVSGEVVSARADEEEEAWESVGAAAE